MVLPRVRQRATEKVWQLRKKQSDTYIQYTAHAILVYMDPVDKKILTLCVVYDEKRILLGMKKRGFGMGRWNGFGGKVEKGETIEQAAHRELKEEAGITARDLKKRGMLHFSFADNSTGPLEVHVFTANSFAGDPKESDEMNPQWFSHANIPYNTMWPDDKHWLPKVLAGKNVKGVFHFKDADTILKMDIREV